MKNSKSRPIYVDSSAFVNTVINSLSPVIKIDDAAAIPEPVPCTYSRILIFDVETTGLIPKTSFKSPPPPVELCPYIIQLSFIVYDVIDESIVQTYNAYIKLPAGVEISPKITEITGILPETCETRGIDIVDALSAFYQAYARCDCVVAHNIAFDRQMIEIELQRNQTNIQLSGNAYCLTVFNPVYENIRKIAIECTMQMSINICNIYIKNARNNSYKKFPKLSELYYKLFYEHPKNLHNSLIDTLCCLRCYLKIRHCIHIHPKKFAKFIEDALVAI